MSVVGGGHQPEHDLVILRSYMVLSGALWSVMRNSSLVYQAMHGWDQTAVTGYLTPINNLLFRMIIENELDDPITRVPGFCLGLHKKYSLYLVPEICVVFVCC